MEHVNVSDFGGKRSLPEDSPSAKYQGSDTIRNQVHVDTPMPRKKFKNNEILSSLSSMKQPRNVPIERPRLDSVDLQIPVPLKRKRAREDSDDDVETPNKKRRKNVSTNSIAVQTALDNESVITFDGDLSTSALGAPDTVKPQYVHPRHKSSILVPVIPSQIRSPLRCFSMDDHARDDKRKEARVRRYLEAIRNSVSGPQPKFYEPPVVTTVVSSSIFTPSSIQSVQSQPVTSATSEVVNSTSVSKSQEPVKPISFLFGSTSSAAATTAAVTSSSFMFAPAISSSGNSIAATTTTTTSTGSITTPLIQPPVTSSPPSFNFNFKPADAPKPSVAFQFGKAEQTFNDSPSASPVPGRKITKGVRRLGSKPESSSNSLVSTSGFAPFSFAPAVTTQAPSSTSTSSQASVFNLPNPNPSLFGAPASQPSNFGSNTGPSFNFGQQTASASSAAPSQPFTFGASNPPSFGASNQSTFNPQVPNSFDFGGGNPSFTSFNPPNNLFTPGTGSVAKRTRKTRGGRR